MKLTKQAIQNRITSFKCKLEEQFRSALHFNPTYQEFRESLKLDCDDYKKLPQEAKERIKEYRDNILKKVSEEYTIKLFKTKRGYIYGYENLTESERSSHINVAKFYWLTEIKTIDENGVVTIIKIPTDNLYIG